MTLPRLALLLLCATALFAARPVPAQSGVATKEATGEKEQAEKKPEQKPDKKGDEKVEKVEKVEKKAGDKSEKGGDDEEESEAWRRIVERKRDEIRERIKDARKRMRRGELVKSHVRVRVKLRNGERLEGVVKNGRFVERPAGLEFVRSDMKMKGAGLRIFYYNGTSGYIFIPYRSIKTYRVLKRLTELEVKSIHDKMKLNEAEALAYAKQRRQEIAEKAEGRAADKMAKAARTKEEKAAAEKKKLEEEQKRLMALVDEFPPSEGWSAERIAELKRRAIIINVYPNEKERRFMDVFEDWQKGVALKKVAEEQEKNGSKPSGSGEKSSGKTEKGSQPESGSGSSGGSPNPVDPVDPGEGDKGKEKVEPEKPKVDPFKK